MRSAVLASFELPRPGSPQFLALVLVILTAAVLTSPQMPDLDDLAGVLRHVVVVASPVATPETPADAPNISFDVPAPVPKPRAAAPVRAPGAPLRPPSPTPSFTDAALASHLEWTPTILRRCEDEVAHAFHLHVFRHYGASVSSLPQSPIRDPWTWVRSHAPSLPGIADVLRTFLASPPPVHQIVDSRAASPAEAEAANQAEGAAKKKGYAPQKVDPQVFSRVLWVGWQENDDPSAGEVDAGLLGGILRDKFGAGLASISEAQLNHAAKFTTVGVKPVDCDKGMKLSRHHIARGWKISWAESKKQPYTPWAPTPTGNNPPARPSVECGDKSTDASRTRRKKWTSLRPRTQAENRRPTTSDGTAHAPRTGPLPPPAALGISTIARRRGAAVPTAMSGWTPVSTTTIATPRPPS